MDTERVAPLVLVVDDDPHVRRLVEVLFERVGFDVVTASNGAQALATLRQGVPDLAIVDRSMPVMDGFELARAIKNRADVPIIILTASSDKDIVVQAIDAFAEDYVVKPFDGRELVARARRVLRRFGELPVQRGQELVLGPDVRLSFSERTVNVQGRQSSLTATESRREDRAGCPAPAPPRDGTWHRLPAGGREGPCRDGKIGLPFTGEQRVLYHDAGVTAAAFAPAFGPGSDWKRHD
jgi:CheY-like chemotaxis protein